VSAYFWVFYSFFFLPYSFFFLTFGVLQHFVLHNDALLGLNVLM
jgi:hypothetical protein